MEKMSRRRRQGRSYHARTRAEVRALPAPSPRVETACAADGTCAAAEGEDRPPHAPHRDRAAVKGGGSAACAAAEGRSSWRRAGDRRAHGGGE